LLLMSCNEMSSCLHSLFHNLLEILRRGGPSPAGDT
jgi:hypothetical protein